MQGLHRGLTGRHTCLLEKEVRASLVKLLGTTALATLALSLAESSTVYRRLTGLFQAQGPYLIESYVAERLHTMLVSEQAQGQQGFFVSPAVDLTQLDVILNAYECSHAIELTQAQRDAVCTNAGASLILVAIPAPAKKAHRPSFATQSLLGCACSSLNSPDRQAP